jgi:hypothetical protein
VLAVGMAVADDSAGEAGGSSWDSIAAVDRESGEVTFLDREGAETGKPLDAGIQDVEYVLGEGPQLALVAADAAGVVDVAAGTVEAPALPEGGRAVRVLTSEPLVLAAGRDAGGEITIISATTSLNVADSAQLDDPLMFPSEVKSDVAGTVFAVADARAAETTVIGPDRRDAASIAGVLLGLTQDIVVTFSPDRGGRAEVRFSSLEGDPVSTTEVPLMRAALVGANGDAVLVTEDGDVLRAAPGDDEAEVVTTIDPPGAVLGGVSALGGQRLLVGADRGVVVLDDQGAVVTTLDLGEPWRRQPLVTNPAQRCVVVVAESGGATMLDLESGETLGTIDDVDFVGPSSTDGCIASVFRRDDAALMREGEEVSLDPEQAVIAVAPTGDHVVVRDGGNRQAWLRDLDDEQAEDVALGPGDGLYAFVDH